MHRGKKEGRKKQEDEGGIRKDTKREEWCVTGKWNRGEKNEVRGKKEKGKRENR